MHSRLAAVMVLLAIAIAIAIAIGIGGCASSRTSDSPVAPSQPTAMDLKRSDMHRLVGLTDALEREGLVISESTSTADPGVFADDATYYAFSVDDGVVRTYLVDSGIDISGLTSRISPDGSRYRSSTGADVYVSWTGRPRFFESGNVIVLYLENQQQPQVSTATDERVMRALTSFMGEPFAAAP